MLINIIIGIFLAFIALTTSIGNLFVLFVFYYEKKLRTINDYFILNMAIADFLVGSFCIPFYIPYCLKQIWPFGKYFCKIWLTIDDMSTMASVINILAISINRYWLIAHPISYRKYIKQHFVYFVMISIWFISFLNFAPGIWLMNFFVNENEDVLKCIGDYNQSFIYMLIAQFNYFICPFILLCILNILIMFNIWKRTRKIKRFRSIQINRNLSQITKSQSSINPDYSPIVRTKYSNSNHLLIQQIETTCRNPFIRRISQISNEFPRNFKKDLRINRDRKAARSLFILVFVFLIFLFPYVSCSIIKTAGFSISSMVSEISFWLLWINSTLNPFLYPFIQTKYRKAYCKLFSSISKQTN